MRVAVLLVGCFFVCFTLGYVIPLERRSNLLQERSKGLNSMKAATIPLHGGEALGLYYIQLSVGNPPQHFTLQFDTGSADLALPLNTCPQSSCGIHEDPYYNPNDSSTSSVVGCNEEGLDCGICQENQCGYTIQYLDRSGFTAEIFNDTVTIGDVSVGQLLGGIITESGNDFEPFQVDGIIGVAYPACSRIQAPTIIDNLVSQTGMEDLFSICMTKNGGTLSLGEIPSIVSPANIQYTPIIEEFYYNIYITDIIIYSRSIGVPQHVYNLGGAAVDTGSTDFLLPDTAYDAIAEIMESKCDEINLVGVCSQPEGQGLFGGFCYEMTEAEVSTFPVITVVLNGGVLLDISPHDWIVQGYCEDPSLYAIAIDPLPARYGTILGDTVLRNRVTVFDRTNRRIGFAPVSSC